MFTILKQISWRPKPFEIYSPEMLWDDDYISIQLLGLHLDPKVEMVSRGPKFIDQSAAWLISYLDITKKTRIADLGCGPGLYSIRFAEQGAEVTGVDISRRSIEFAKQTAIRKNLSIEYISQNYFDFRSPKKFDLIFMIFCDFCSFGPDKHRLIFRKFHDILADEGAVVLDVYTLNQFNLREEFINYEHVEYDGFWSADEYFGFLNIFKYEDEKVILDKYTLIEKKRTRMFYNWLQYFGKESLFNIFEENGFQIESYFANLAGLSYTDDALEIAVVARKR
jgi:SAM-dependent methyltransferase